jgi:pyruvate phosphate dikinase-like enzyme
MVPNIHVDFSIRLEALSRAVKLVFASTYLEISRSFSESTLHRTEEEKMAVIIQQVVGSRYGDFFYPAISGVVHSYNFYPVSHMQPEDGVAHIALGLGKTVMDGGTSLRFSPKHPEFLPGYSTVEEILENSQRSFYALDLSGLNDTSGVEDDLSLVQIEIDEATSHYPITYLCGTYVHEEHRIRPSLRASGSPVLTFANVLKGISIDINRSIWKHFNLYP